MSRIPIACPRCASESWIRVDHLGGQLHCKSCSARFYIDATGHYALGDRPATLRPPDAFAPIEPTRGAHRGIEWLERLPGPARYAALGGLGLLALGLAARAWIASARAAAIPESLEGRASYVAEAFARDRPGAIAPLLAEGRPREVVGWIDRARPASWDWAGGEEVRVRTELKVKDERAGTAMVIATILPPGRPPPAAAGGPAPRRAGGLDLPLYWALDDRGGWALDLPRTLRAAPRAK